MWPFKKKNEYPTKQICPDKVEPAEKMRGARNSFIWFSDGLVEMKKEQWSNNLKLIKEAGHPLSYYYPPAKIPDYLIKEEEKW